MSNPSTIDKLRQEIEADSAINPTDLAGESLRTIKLHSKYLNTLTMLRSRCVDLEIEDKRVAKLKREYYSGRLSRESLAHLGWDQFPHKVLKSEVDSYVDGDDDRLKIQSDLAHTRVELAMVEEMLKSINNRQWIIKNAIEWRKFQEGYNS